MRKIEMPVEMASHHVMEADIRCSRQLDLAERLATAGQDTAVALVLLDEFQAIPSCTK
jgi:hypothetical protein